MHEFTPEVQALAAEVLAYSLDRLKNDPPLDGPRTAEDLYNEVGNTITARGLGGHEALEVFTSVLAKACISTDHPRNLAFIPSAPSEYANLFDLVVGASALYGGSWQEGAGAVFAETVRRGATGGFKAALAVQIGSLVGDATWAVLGLMGVGLLLQVDALKWPVGLVGAAYLIWLSWDSWKAASIAFSVNENQDEKARSGLKSATDRFASK